jgi:hypothetical protein
MNRTVIRVKKWSSLTLPLEGGRPFSFPLVGKGKEAEKSRSYQLPFSHADVRRPPLKRFGKTPAARRFGRNGIVEARTYCSVGFRDSPTSGTDCSNQLDSLIAMTIVHLTSQLVLAQEAYVFPVPQEPL